MKWGWWVVAICALVWLLWGMDQSDAQVAEWAERARVAEFLRKATEDKARTDSLVLVRLQQDYTADTLRLAQERAQSRQEAQRARQDGKRAAEALRATLDAQQAVLLDSLEASHAAEVAALETQVQQADSATTVERSLRVATEQALASERQAHQASLQQIDALEGQVRGLEAARKRSQKERYILGGAVALTLLLVR